MIQFLQPRFQVLICCFGAVAVLAAATRHCDAAGDQNSTGTGRQPPACAIVWQQAEPLRIPGFSSGDSLLTARFAEGGAVLYVTARRDGGEANIYVTRLADGRWQNAQLVSELNTAADDIIGDVSSDGRELYLYSNRAGGSGGMDLYVALREDQRWSEPRNLGPRINTAADESCPVVSPNGQRLFFSSNRDQWLHERTAATGAAGDLQASRAVRDSDPQAYHNLYAARRDQAEARWQPAEPLVHINRSYCNETAPSVSPSGDSLYFASDRTTDSDGRNYDLYRAALIGGIAHRAERLGPEINTAANELHAAISPACMQMIFSSDRSVGTKAASRAAASPALYLSTTPAGITRAQQPWFSVPSIARYRWWLVASILLAAFIVAAVWSLRHLSLRRFSVPVFPLIALLLHVLLGAGLFFVGIGDSLVTVRRTIDELITFDYADSIHQTADPGSQSAYEKVADLQRVARENTADIARHSFDRLDAPVASTYPVASAPASDPGRVSPELIVIAAPPAPRSPLPMTSLKRRASPMSGATPVDEALELEAIAMPQRASEPILERIDVQAGRIESPQPVVSAPPAAALKTAAAPSTPAEIEVETIVPAPRPASPRLARATVTLTDTFDFPSFSEAVSGDALRPASFSPPAEQVQVARAAVPDATLPTAPRPDTRPAPLLTVAAPPAVGEADVDKPAGSTNVTASLIRSISQPLLAAPLDEVLLQLEPPASPSPPSSLADAGDLAISVEIVRAANLLPGLPAQSLVKRSGQPDPLRPAPLVGGLPNENVDSVLPPKALASNVARRPARAPLMLYAEDSIGLQAMLRQRQDESMKQDLLEAFGGNDQTLVAVRRGLNWLAQHQFEDGHWSFQFHECCRDHAKCDGHGSTGSDVAATGLCLLSLLGDSHTHQSGEHQAVVQRGLQWLVKRQKDDGELTAGNEGIARMYSHAIGAIALCEAYGMTSDAELEEPARRAIDFIIAAQHRDSGGWRYQPNQRADTSVVGWQMMALKSAQMAGLAVPSETYVLVAKWLDSVEGQGNNRGRYGYQDRNPKAAMTAEALLCREYLSTSRSDSSLIASADYLLSNLPRSGTETSYYWYYGTQAMFHLQGEYWHQWNNALRDLLVSTQITEGPKAGTWDPRDQWERSGGRIYSTSLRLLMLEVYYRHLPLYQMLDDVD